MKKKEIKKLSKTEILKNLESFKKDLFNLRFQKIMVNLKVQLNLKKHEKVLQD